jgi:cytochrome c oxidase subunit 4
MATNVETSRMGEPEEAHAVSEPMPHHHVNYLLIFGCLIVLTALTVAVAFFHFSAELITVGIALAIAFTKATLVARYFMHLKFEGKLIYLILFAPLCLCVILCVALIPDIGRGRSVGFNDMIHWMDQAFPSGHDTHAK